ncbi:Glycosyltransferase [Melia azedarach]|uniref:Glycosyltransferase n=1 Tax=Melia azedarach TaxID=155640 RepID=A0ACC1XVB2_MELAZ|nr:Glycosyltransferase [Melia azedarach]
MGSIGATKPHVVCIPYPAQGHITPMIQLAKLLHSRGFHVTFVNTEFNHKRFIRNRGPGFLKGLPDFRFETIPDGLPPSDRDATQDIIELCVSLRRTGLASFLELLGKLNSSADVPTVTCIVSDGAMGFGAVAARMLGVTDVKLWTASACGFMAYLQYAELLRRGIVPFEDEKFLTDGTLDTPVDWIPGMSNMRLRDFPSLMRVTDANDFLFNYMNTEAQNCLKSSAIIFNTFDEFESEVLEVIASKFPNIYTIGPLCLLCKHLSGNELMSFRSSLWKEDSECLKWLDNKEPNSVVYVNYGSITVMTDQHLKEFAWGLASSKHPFLWIVRPDLLMGDSAIFPEAFFEEIKDRGLIANWCPQDEILSHPSIGVFLTHCGWNSTLESVCGGLPVICWPFFAEQQTNCRYSCTTWGMGVEVNTDVKQEDIAKLIKEMMEGDKGKQMRQKAQEWKRKAEASTEIGGRSYKNFGRCIKEALHYDH